jgi:hypothetical protein
VDRINVFDVSGGTAKYLWHMQELTALAGVASDQLGSTVSLMPIVGGAFAGEVLVVQGGSSSGEQRIVRLDARSGRVLQHAVVVPAFADDADDDFTLSVVRPVRLGADTILLASDTARFASNARLRNFVSLDQQ